MENIIYGLAGLVIGGVATSIWMGSKIKELKNTILDKRTVVRFLKEALTEVKPKKTYKRKPTRKYNSNGKPKATRKPSTRKKYEKAS
tara:strand:- start:155 stop:415 length:261 start_codon:yes stop_codon:yes gene_type:complete